MRAGAMERFLQATAPVLLSDSECRSQGQQQHAGTAAAAAADEVKQEQPAQQQLQHAAASSPLKRQPADAVDCTSDSPELLPLAARLQAHKSKLGAAGAAAAATSTAAAAAVAAGSTGMAPPAKKASTDRAKELLASPTTPSSQHCQQQKALSGAAGAAAAAGQGRLTAQFAALLDEAGVLSPVPQRQQAGTSASRPKSAKELFAARPVSRQQQQQDVIELLDSPGDAGGLQRQHCLDAGHGSGVVDAVEDDDADVVDLT